MIQIYKNSEVVAQSRNLRGLIEYARNKSDVKIVSCFPKDDDFPPRMAVSYDDGAHCIVEWRSYHIMVDWVRARRKWRESKALIQYHGADVGYFSYPGVVAGGVS